MYSYNENIEVVRILHKCQENSYTRESKIESAQYGLIGKYDGSLERNKRQLGSESETYGKQPSQKFFFTS